MCVIGESHQSDSDSSDTSSSDDEKLLNYCDDNVTRERITNIGTYLL